MAAKKSPNVVTANALLEGDVIYLAEDGTWTRKHTQACIFDEQADAANALAKAEELKDFLVGAYLAEFVRDETGTPQPVHYREKFRAFGPTGRPRFAS